MEVTKWLKPSDSASRIGDGASVQAVTRVNAEQTLYGAFEVKHLFHGMLHFLRSSFFVRPGIPFLRPTRRIAKPARAGVLKVGRRPNLAAYSGLARPHLDNSEHDGPLDAVGTMIRGGALPSGAVRPIISESAERQLMAPSASSRRCSDMAAVGGTPDGRWTRPMPPLLTRTGLRAALV
jgi:hypothetical protein